MNTTVKTVLWATSRCINLKSKRAVTPITTAPARIRHRTLRTVPPNEAFKILFLGRDEFSCVVLQELYRCQDVWKEIWVATTPDAKTGRRGSILSVSPLGNLGRALDLSVVCVPLKEQLRHWEPPPPFSSISTPPPNHCIVTASFGRLIPSRLLQVFPPSCRLNVHPSLLPIYRGPAPIQHTIADGRKDTGVCVIEMRDRKEGADVGDVWGRTEMTVPDDADFLSLRDSLALQGGKLLVSVLRQMMNKTAKAVPQSSFSSQVIHAPRITQQTATIDFQIWDAPKVIRMHRAISHQKHLTASLPSPASSTLQLHSPIVHRFPTSSASIDLPHETTPSLSTPGSATYDPTTSHLLVRCASDTYIRVPEVKQQDKALISAREWWNGNKWKDWVREGVVQLH